MTDADGVLRALNAATTESVRRIELSFYRNVTFANPVDTGFSRGSWFPTVGRPANVEPTDRPKDRETAEKLGRQQRTANTREAVRISEDYRLRGGRVFFVNPVKYIRPLNRGTSSQAPAMFVERAIVRAIRSAGRATRRSTRR